MRKYFTGLLLLPAIFLGQAIQQKEAFSTLNYARDITETLCSREYEGRGYVNNGCHKAGTFILDEFKRLNLKPFQGAYEQSFSFDVNTFPKACRLIQGLHTLRPGIDFIVHPSSSGYHGVLRLQKMSASQIMNYRFSKATPSNSAIVFAPEKGFPKDSLKLVKSKLEKIAQIDRPVVEVTREKLTWSVAEQAFKFPYLQWYDTVQKSTPKKLRVKVDAAILSQYKVQNCFGFVPSINPSDSLIVVSAHYDHLGKMGKKTMFPGANDNASGVAMLLSLAREIHEKPLHNHSVLFVAFAGEEIGLKGSFAFVEAGIIDLTRISMVLNLDILGSGEEGITVVNGSVFPMFYQRLVELNKSIPAVPVVKSRGKAANSDHYPFSEKGVPSLFVYTMGPNKNYHDIHDKYENLSFDRFESLHYLFLRFLNGF